RRGAGRGRVRAGRAVQPFAPAARPGKAQSGAGNGRSDRAAADRRRRRDHDRLQLPALVRGAGLTSGDRERRRAEKRGAFRRSGLQRSRRITLRSSALRLLFHFWQTATDSTGKQRFEGTDTYVATQDLQVAVN